ncbi:hypothetical protein TorRG33x02_277170 [Trema orientale]|uniref:Uncharacterized protein n=1 Tax=Trema orientale TaxID=63057 RepID=A0A2P5CQ65_TREOI|nr:hypothetical protein TorRG33x02_277170 [Trema orientale]
MGLINDDKFQSLICKEKPTFYVTSKERYMYKYGIQLSNCPKYRPEIVARIFSVATSSSVSTFPASKSAHFLSRLRSEALVSASIGVSTTAQSANSHMQSIFNKVFIPQKELIRFFNIDTRATESIFNIKDNKG